MARKKVSVVFSHWYHLIEGLEESSQQFYINLEQAIAKRQLPDVKYQRVIYREGSILSAKREYLQTYRKEHVFDICAAPFGKGFFISWWLGESMSLFWRLLLTIPGVGIVLLKIFHPETYYRLDTALMFQESVHAAVLEMIDNLTKAKGLRILSESERKPVLGNIFKK